MESAWLCWRSDDDAFAAYLAGLAVECVLQAIALRDDPQHDARHDLTAWLRKCPPAFQDAITTPPMRNHWSRLLAMWSNRSRYYDGAALLGLLRRTPQWRRLRGDENARMRQAVRSLLLSAVEVRQKGLAEWHRRMT